MKFKKKFTPAEDARICEMARKATPVADIAATVDRPDRAIRDRLDRLVANGELSREARLSTKARRVSEPTNAGAGAGGWPIRCAGAVHSSAIERARAKADQMIAAGMDPNAARLEVKQTTGLAI